jgi:putative transposase
LIIILAFCLGIYPEQGIKGEQVVTVLERLQQDSNAIPEKFRVDNGLNSFSRHRINGHMKIRIS